MDLLPSTQWAPLWIALSLGGRGHPKPHHWGCGLQDGGWVEGVGKEQGGALLKSSVDPDLSPTPVWCSSGSSSELKEEEEEEERRKGEEEGGRRREGEKGEKRGRGGGGEGGEGEEEGCSRRREDNIDKENEAH
ncbi:Major centromere autoantigen B, partial [Ophiophagus hannah]